MKSLIVEDDYITSQVIKEILSTFGEAEIAENGKIAIEKFQEAYNENDIYDVVFLDIMMPELDGHETLSLIRQFEYKQGIMGLDAVKIIMTTALDDFDNIKSSFDNQCEGYIVKPVDKDKIISILAEQGLIN